MKIKITKGLFIYYSNKKNQRINYNSNVFYDSVMEFKELKKGQGTFKEKIFINPTGKSIKGHFVHDLTRLIFQK